MSFEKEPFDSPDIVPLLDDEKSEMNLLSNRQKIKRKVSNGLRLFLTLALLISILSNALQFAKSRRTFHEDIGGIGYETPTIYQEQTDYWGDDVKLADDVWAALSTDHSNIALTEAKARHFQLSLNTQPFPWDSSRRVYILKVYHQLHCLKSIRESLIRYQRGHHQLTSEDHIHHCLDTLRKDIMCLADDTPMHVDPITSSIGDGQVRQCRSLDALAAWVEAPDQNACYRTLSDYKKLNNTIERFAFCPEGSQYEPVAREYFEQQGHSNPFVSGAEDRIGA